MLHSRSKDSAGGRYYLNSLHGEGGILLAGDTVNDSMTEALAPGEAHPLEPDPVLRPRPRGRPRKADLLASPNANLLRVRQEVNGDVITLHLSGSLELANLLDLRDAAFSAIGLRPKILRMDLRSVISVEIASINTLVTIGRVASLTQVEYRVIPSTVLRETLQVTGLYRLLPPDSVRSGENDAVSDLTLPPPLPDGQNGADAD